MLDQDSESDDSDDSGPVFGGRSDDEGNDGQRSGNFAHCLVLLIRYCIRHY